MQKLKRFELQSAIQDFYKAQSLGAAGGDALFAIGMTQHALGHPGDALQYLQKAEAEGYSDVLLQFHRGESQLALGLYAPAVTSYTKALDGKSKSVPVELAHAHRAEAQMRLQDFRGARGDFETLTALDPKQSRYRVGLGLALLGLKDAAGALPIFDALAQEKPDALAFYGRALAQYNLNNIAAATRDIARAIELDSRNLTYQQVQESMKKGERLSL